MPYHAGLAAEVRRATQRRFVNDEVRIIVATVAFGMGIDKPDVRFVYHLDPPKSLEAYYQETGRAGRDGLPATAMMTWGLADVAQLRQFIAAGESEARRQVEHHKLSALLGLLRDRAAAGARSCCSISARRWPSRAATATPASSRS